MKDLDCLDGSFREWGLKQAISREDQEIKISSRNLEGEKIKTDRRGQVLKNRAKKQKSGVQVVLETNSSEK